MKLLKSLSLFICLIVALAACDNQLNVNPNPVGDEELIDAIESSTDKQEVSIEALPNNASSTLDIEYAENFVNHVSRVTNLGYEVTLRRSSGEDCGTATRVFFDESGRELQSARRADDETMARPDRMRERCFNLVLPVDLTMPDGSTITIETREDWLDVKGWYEANPDAEGCPHLNYPVNITFNNGTVKTINNALEMRRAKRACRAIKERPHCFKLVFPVTFTMPDGSSITLDSKEDWALIKAWYDANSDTDQRPALNFPVEIQLRNGQTVSIENAEQMRRAKERCD